MRDGGMVHADCSEGYLSSALDPMAVEFAASIHAATLRDASAFA